MYDDLKISVEITRCFFLIAFFIYLYIMIPRMRYWPLWLFLISFGIYFIFFDALPRLINNFNRKSILSLFLVTYTIPYILTKPLQFISKIKNSEKEVEEQREASEDEIRALIEEAKEEGIIEMEEGVLLKSVVEFGDTIVREIMTPRVSMICIRNDATVKKLRDLVIQEKHSRIPVYKDRVDNIEGVVNAKDLLEYSEDKLKDSPIESLIRPVFFVPESMKVAELLKELQKRKQKIAVVVDEHGGVSGLVTMEDLMEEIVGEIQDEYDKDVARIVEKGPNEYFVSGSTEVEEIEDLFDMELAEDDFITISGMITHHLGRLPELGEKVDLKGLSMEILDVDQKRIKKLKLRKTSSDKPNE
jgi:CBS domain containing-hemolysin-like protein